MHCRLSDPGAAGWAAADPLSSVLLDLRLSGTFFCNSEFGSPWSVEIPERDCASFHFVTASSGACWLQPLLPAKRLPAVELRSGDLILLARSPRHVFSSDKRTEGVDVAALPSCAINRTAAMLRMGYAGADGRSSEGAAGSEARWVVVCGGVRFESFVGSALVNLLPEVVLLRKAEAGSIVTSALEAMQEESLSARPGSVTLMARLADVVIIHAIRGWLERLDARSGWLAALRDAQIGRVMAELHRQPQRPWSLEAMARIAGLSRSRFSERFNQLVGAAPIQYLTRIRMHRAAEHLQFENLSVAELAERFGYDSESAFARAFKRHMGVSPGSVRRNQSAQVQ
jgi:AraC-like DNA-binding protein